jgi:hypothetical protein
LRNLEQVTEATTVLFRVQPDLANHVPMLGHITKVVELFKRPSTDVQVLFNFYMKMRGFSFALALSRRRRCW